MFPEYEIEEEDTYMTQLPGDILLRIQRTEAWIVCIHTIEFTKS